MNHCDASIYDDDADLERCIERAAYYHPESGIFQSASPFANQNERALVTIARAFGCGDITKGIYLLCDIMHDLCRARAKHSWQGIDLQAAYDAISDEMIELSAETDATPEGRQRIREEGCDVITTVVRLINREWEQSPCACTHACGQGSTAADADAPAV